MRLLFVFSLLVVAVVCRPRLGIKKLENKIHQLLDETKEIKRVLEQRHHKKKDSKKVLKSVADVNFYKYGLKDDIRYRKGNQKRNQERINKWNPEKEGQKLVIPYKFKQGFPYKSEVEEAIKSMNKHLKCDHDAWVPYSESSGHKHYVEFFKEGGCWSYLGKALMQQSEDGKATKQMISIGDGCQYKHIILHELMHAMGFIHEQNRVDRDDHIIILWQNIEDGMDAQFQKQTSDNVFQTSVPYDFMSVMQYSLDSFSKNGNPTMRINPKSKQGKKLSAADLKILGDVPDLSRRDLKELLAYFKCTGGSGSGKTIVTTKAPVFTTKAPVFTTKASVFTTKAPVFTTKAPVFTTKAPVFTTKVPVFTTKAPVDTTESPVDTTDYIFETTDSNVETTNGTDSSEGTDGTDSSEGTDGTDSSEGTDRTDSSEGTDGTDSSEGTDGTDSSEGTDGTDGIEGTDSSKGTDGTDGSEGTEGTDSSEGTDETESSKGTEQSY